MRLLKKFQQAHKRVGCAELGFSVHLKAHPRHIAICTVSHCLEYSYVANSLTSNIDYLTRACMHAALLMFLPPEIAAR